MEHLPPYLPCPTRVRSSRRNTQPKFGASKGHRSVTSRLQRCCISTLGGAQYGWYLTIRLPRFLLEHRSANGASGKSATVLVRKGEVGRGLCPIPTGRMNDLSSEAT